MSEAKQSLAIHTAIVAVLYIVAVYIDSSAGRFDRACALTFSAMIAFFLIWAYSKHDERREKWRSYYMAPHARRKYRDAPGRRAGK